MGLKSSPYALIQGGLQAEQINMGDRKDKSKDIHSLTAAALYSQCQLEYRIYNQPTNHLAQTYIRPAQEMTEHSRLFRPMVYQYPEHKSC